MTELMNEPSPSDQNRGALLEAEARERQKSLAGTRPNRTPDLPEKIPEGEKPTGGKPENEENMRVDTHHVNADLASECREIGAAYAGIEHCNFQDGGYSRRAWTRGTWEGSLPGEPEDDEEAEYDRRYAVEQMIDDAAESEWDRLWDETERGGDGLQTAVNASIPVPEKR